MLQGAGAEPAGSSTVADLVCLSFMGLVSNCPGETVGQAVDGFMAVLDELNDLEGMSVEITEAASAKLEGPARALIEISGSSNKEGRKRWLVAESRWADTFNPPGLGRMTGWSLVFGWHVLRRLFAG